MDAIFQYLQDSLTELLIIAAVGGIAIGAVLALIIGRRRGTP
jgi:hypothetical protein